MKAAFLSLAILAAFLATLCAEPPMLRVLGDFRTVPREVCLEFTEKTGIPVEVVSPNSSLHAYQLLNEPGERFDLLALTSDVITPHLREGKLLPLDRKLIPYASEKLPEWISQKGERRKFVVPLDAGTMGLLVHRHTPQAPVTGYESLFRSPRPGGVAVLVEQRDFLAAALLSLGAAPGDHRSSNLRASKILLLDWLKNTAAESLDLWVKPLRGGYDKLLGQLAEGRHAAAIVYSGDAISLMDARPGCYEWVIPEEGTFKFVTELAIPRSSPRSAEAHRFMNHLLSPASTALLASIAAPGVPVQLRSASPVPGWVFGIAASEPSAALFNATPMQTDILQEDPPLVLRFLQSLPAPSAAPLKDPPACARPSSQ